MKNLQARAKAVNDIYVENFGLERDGLMLIGKITEEVGELAGAYLKCENRSRGADGDKAILRQELQDEAADLLGFLMVFAEVEGIDLEAAFERKWGKYLPE